MTKNLNKGFYGIFIQKYLLEERYKITHDPKNGRYDLPSKLNSISGSSVFIKASKNCRVYCSNLFNFLDSTDFEIIYISYEILVPRKKIRLNYVYLLDMNDTKKLIDNANLDKEKLDYLKTVVNGFSYPNNETRKFCTKLSRIIDKDSLFTVNCKLGSKNKRIQLSFSFKTYLKTNLVKILKEYSGRILNI